MPPRYWFVFAHSNGAAKRQALRTKWGYDAEELFDATDLDIDSFTENGFILRPTTVQIVSIANQPNRICYVQMEFAHSTAVITLTAFMRGAPPALKRYEGLPYQYTKFYNRKVGIYENSTRCIGVIWRKPASYIIRNRSRQPKLSVNLWHVW